MRKKFLRTALLLLVLCAVLPVAAFAEDAVVTGNDVNLRSGPGTDYEIIDCLPLHAVVTVNDRSNSTWYAISYNGQDGFMSSRYLQLMEEDAPEIQPIDVSVGYINAMYVNFRSSNSTDSTVLGQYNKGKTLIVHGLAGEQWVYVNIDGQDGYVFREYVSPGEPEGSAGYEEPQPEPQPEPEPEPEQPSSPGSEQPEGSYIGHVTGDYVRFRTGPSTSHTIIDSYNRGQILYALYQEGDWIRAVINGKEGSIHANYVLIEEAPSSGESEEPADEPQTQESGGEPYVEPYIEYVGEIAAYVNANDVRFRSYPSMTSEILSTFYYGKNVTVIGFCGDWVNVYVDGVCGFIYNQYLSEGTYSMEVSGGEYGSGTGAEIASFALQFVGYNYCWGGASPETGFDCSGLVYYTYQHFGITLNRVAADQAYNGDPVSADELQPGDILCFYSGGDYIGHSGIYIGDGKFVHACNSNTGVIISELFGGYWDRGFEARRIV